MYAWICLQSFLLDGSAKEQIDTNKTPTQIEELSISKTLKCACKLSKRKKKSSHASARKQNQEVKIKGMYTVSLNQAHKPVEPQRELWNAAAVRFHIKLVLISFSQLHTVSHIASCISVWPLLFFCSQSLHSNNVHSHTWVWYSSACLVQCRQPVGLLLCTTTRKGAITLVKVLDCVSVCVYVCIPDRPIDPQDCCPPGLPAYQAEIQHSMSDGSIPVLQVGQC